MAPAIQSLTIENFQSHQKTVVRPAPDGQLTVIIGPSDSGKTAIIRALRWLLYNVPQGADFIRVGTEFARVTLELADGTRVTRERGKSYNRYILIPAGGERQVFEGFGNNVPLEVQEATGVRMTTIGDMELALNLSEQLDGPFLGKSVSAPARAKVLGKLAGTEEIDYAGKQLAADLHRRGQDEKRLAAELSALEEQIRGYDYLPALAEKIAALEEIVAAVKAAAERRQRLAGRQEALRQVEAGMAAAQVVLQKWQYIDLAEYALAGAEKSAAQAAVLRQAASRLRVAEEAISVARGTLERLAGLEEARAAVAQAEGILQRRQQVRQLGASLAGVDSAILTAREVAEKYANLPAVEEATRAAAAAAERQVAIIRVGGLYRQVAAAIRQSEDTARRLAGVEEADKALAQAGAAQERLGKVIDLASRLRQVEVEGRKAREAAALWEQKVADLEGAYRDELVAAGKCPVCGNIVNPENLKEVV